jgi:hypothetical protein
MSRQPDWEKTYPFQRVEIEILDLAVVEEARQPDAIVRHVWLLADDDNVVLSRPRVQLEEFLTSYVRFLVLIQSKKEENWHETDAHHAQPDNHHLLPHPDRHGAVYLFFTVSQISRETVRE